MQNSKNKFSEYLKYLDNKKEIELMIFGIKLQRLSILSNLASSYTLFHSGVNIIKLNNNISISKEF